DLGTLLQETDGVLQLEIVIVIVSVRAETNLFDNNLGSICLYLFLLLLLLIQKLLIINYFADWRVSIWRYLNKIKFHFISQPESITDAHYRRFYVLSHNPYGSG